ncbi:MAG: site-specific integrase, partial [Proteobacteria bacterium]|nr:site-specific integrase [Pseudomonadota bacterium]
ENNPTDMVPAPKPPEKKPKAVDQDTVEGLVSSCKGSRNPRRDKAMVLFLLDTGARATEMATVKIKDVNFTSGKVKVLGKGKKERFVYLGKRALSALWLYVKEERPEPAQVNCKFVFLTIEGYSMDRNSIRRVLYRLSERGCEKRIHPHQLRHTSAIERLRHGMDLISVQHLLGHRDLKTTRGYLDALTDEDVEARAKRTSPGDNWRL